MDDNRLIFIVHGDSDYIVIIKLTADQLTVELSIDLPPVIARKNMFVYLVENVFVYLVVTCSW